MKLRKDIQGLRAIAIIYVLAFHADLPLNGGFIGVDVFFVISGYVICSKLLKEKELNGTFSLASFYTRRIFRIFPALVFMIVFVLIASFIILSPGQGQENVVKGSVASLLSLSNLFFAFSAGGYFDSPSEANPLLHTWSLSVEEQFYLVFPLLLLFIFRRSWKSNKKTFEIQWILALSILSYLSINLVSPDFLFGAFGFYSPISRAWEFGLGILVSLIHNKYKIKTGIATTLISVVCVLVLLISPFVIKGTTDFPNHTLFPTLLSVALIILFKSDDLISRFLSLSLFQFLGKYSYSIYLWHWPFVVYSQFLFPGNGLAKVCGTLFAFIPAVISYQKIETRFMNIEYQTGRSFVILLSFPLIFFGALNFVAHNGFWNTNIQTFRSAVSDVHVGRQKGCFTDTSLRQLDLKKCTWGIKREGEPIYLLGDSNSEQFSEAVINLGKLVSSPVIITGASACPFIGGVIDNRNMSEEWNLRCNAFNTESLSFLRNATSGVVIIGNIDSYFYEASDNIFGVGLSENSLAYSGKRKNEEFERILTRTLQQLSSSGHQIVLIQTIPNWVGESLWEPAWCTSLEVLRGGCIQRMSKTLAFERQGVTRSILERANELSKVTLIDPWELLCQEKVCSTHLRARPYYKDGSHISVKQSVLFTSLFYQVFKEATSLDN